MKQRGQKSNKKRVAREKTKTINTPSVRLRLEEDAAATIKGGRSARTGHQSPKASGKEDLKFTKKKMSSKLTLRYSTDFGSSDAKKQRALLSEPAGKLFDRLHTILKKLKTKPYSLELTREQEKMLTVVSRLDQWERIADEFKREVREWGAFTFDTEDFLPDHAKLKDTPVEKRRRQDEARLMYVIFGSMEGQATVFDLESLNGGPVSDEAPLACLPKDVRRLLTDSELVALGSDIARDMNKIGIAGVRLCETAEIFKRYSSVAGGKIINVGKTNKSGMGIQAYWSKGFDHKASNKTAHEKDYGEHRYNGSSGKRPGKWPGVRAPTILFKWYKAGNRMVEHQRHYCFHDATTPVALVIRILMEQLLSKRLDYAIQPKAKDVLGHIIHEDIECNVPELELMCSDYDDDSEVEVLPRQTPAKATVSANAVTPVCVPADDQADAEVQVVAVLGHPRVAPIKGTSFHYFDADIRRLNPYREYPKWPRVCAYCGDATHSMYDHKKELLCPVKEKDQPSTSKCKYLWCKSPNKHYVDVCPDLHRRCTVCFHRGHGKEDGCEDWDEEKWEDALVAFEKVADAGVWTKFRQSEDRWTFWTHVAGAPTLPWFAPNRVLVRHRVLEINKALGLQPTVEGFDRHAVSTSGPKPGFKPAKRPSKDEGSKAKKSKR